MAKPAPTISDRASWQASEAYLIAVGQVVLAWNNLQEKLGDLFVAIVQTRNSDVALAIWHAPFSDRVQRDLLKEAIEASDDVFWKRLPDRAKADLIEVLNKITSLGSKRDDAIHAPIVFDTAGQPEITADFFSKHRRAKNLVGKDLVSEFDYLKRYAEGISSFIDGVLDVLRDQHAPWPKIPTAPSRKPKKSLGQGGRQSLRG